MEVKATSRKCQYFVGVGFHLSTIAADCCSLFGLPFDICKQVLSLSLLIIYFTSI